MMYLKHKPKLGEKFDVSIPSQYHSFIAEVIGFNRKDPSCEYILKLTNRQTHVYSILHEYPDTTVEVELAWFEQEKRIIELIC